MATQSRLLTGVSAAMQTGVVRDANGDAALMSPAEGETHWREIMSPEQIAWAGQHDWFHSARRGMVFAWETWTNPDGSEGRLKVAFNTYADLRIWAGY